MLEGVEANLCEYERMTERDPSDQRATPNSFTGYTTALLNAVARMSVYFREVSYNLLENSINDLLWQICG